MLRANDHANALGTPLAEDKARVGGDELGALHEPEAREGRGTAGGGVEGHHKKLIG